MNFFFISMITISSLWFISEVLINLLTRSKRSGTPSLDRNSMTIIWIVILASVSAGIFISFSHPQFDTIKFFSGFFLMITGMSFRLFTVFSLKKFFTANVAIHRDHSLKTDGAYKWIRHPSYLGSLVTFAGFGLVLGNGISLLIILLPVTAAFLYRVRIEENVLADHFKEEYTDYQKRTKKLIPFVY